MLCAAVATGTELTGDIRQIPARSDARCRPVSPLSAGICQRLMRRQSGEPLCERSRHAGQDRRRPMQYMLMICDNESMILSLAEVPALPRIQAWDADVDARGIRRGGTRLRLGSVAP